MNRKLKNLILTIFFCVAAMPVFAVEEYVSLVYKEIDVAFANRSDENLDKILQKYQGDNNYFLMENYSMKKVRRLIIINDYEFAMDADLVIIDNNLDNIEAVELYATITDAYEMQKAVERLAEEKRKAEEIRLVNLKEEQRGSAAKQYNTVKTSTGNTVYVTGKDGGQLTYNGFNYSLGLVPGLVTNKSNTGVENNLTEIALGVGFDFGYYTMLKNMNVGVDVGFSARPMSFAFEGTDESIFFDGNINLKIAFRDFMDKLFIRAGVVDVGCFQGRITENFNQELQKNLISPAVGIKLQEVPLGNIFLTADFDWLAAHLYTKGLDAAAQMNVLFSIPFGSTEKINMDFIIGIKDTMFMKETGFENRMNFVLALGGRNVK